MPILKTTLKRLRASQPLNYVATSAVHSLLSATGRQSEFVIKHLHRVGTVEFRLPNGRTARLWSRGDDWVSNQVFWRGWGGYEPETTPLFYRLATAARTTFDIGAHVGFFTVLAAHANPAGAVFAFEPLPTVFQRLQQNVALNHLTNVECLTAAVGDQEGTAEFFHLGRELPSSSGLSLEFMRTIGEVQSLKVSVLTLDRFVQERGLGRVDLVKIDTETTEPQVLRGMTEILQRDQPMLICEVLTGAGAEPLLEQILRPFGYRFYHLTPNGPILRDCIAAHDEWRNYLFTPLKPDEVERL